MSGIELKFEKNDGMLKVLLAVTKGNDVGERDMRALDIKVTDLLRHFKDTYVELLYDGNPDEASFTVTNGRLTKYDGSGGIKDYYIFMPVGKDIPIPKGLFEDCLSQGVEINPNFNEEEAILYDTGQPKPSKKP